MIVWNGRLKKGEAFWSYNLHFTTDADDVLRVKFTKAHPGHVLCHVDSMWRRLKDINEGDDINTWGYSAKSTDQMALAVLGWTVIGFDAFQYSCVTALPEYLNRPLYKPSKPLRKLILKYYKAFAEEILANLPDNWTLTEIEILEWLNKKEKEAFQSQSNNTK